MVEHVDVDGVGEEDAASIPTEPRLRRQQWVVEFFFMCSVDGDGLEPSENSVDGDGAAEARLVRGDRVETTFEGPLVAFFMFALVGEVCVGWISERSPKCSHRLRLLGMGLDQFA